MQETKLITRFFTTATNGSIYMYIFFYSRVSTKHNSVHVLLCEMMATEHFLCDKWEVTG